MRNLVTLRHALKARAAQRTSDGSEPSRPSTGRRHRSPRRVPVVVAGATAALTAFALAAPVAGALTANGPRAATRAVRADYSVRFAGDAKTVAAGGSVDYSVVVRVTGRFRGVVVFELPNISPALKTRIIPQGTNRAVLRVDVPAGVPAHTGVYILRARSGNLVRDALFRLTVTAPSTAAPAATAPPTAPSAGKTFTLRADNPVITVRASQTAAFGVTVDRSGGYTGNVRFTASGLPAGVRSNFAPNPTVRSTVFYATPSAATPDGDYRITATATAADGSTTRVTNFVLSVRNRADFALTVPASATVAGGATSYLQIGYRSLSAAPPTVSLAISGVPLGITTAFTPNPTFGQTTLTVTVAKSVPAGTYPMLITATAGAVVHQYPLSLVVLGPPDFALTVPASASVLAGATSYVQIGYRPLATVSPTVSLNVAGLPVGVSATFTPNPTFGQSTLVVTTAATTPVGVYPLVITGTAGTVIHQYSLALAVTGTATTGSGTVNVPPVPNATGTPGYGLAAVPGAVTIARGSTGTMTVNVTPTGTFSGTVQLGVSGLPAGTTATVTGGTNTATVTFNVPAGAVPGTSSVTVTATSGTLSATISVGLTIT